MPKVYASSGDEGGGGISVPDVPDEGGGAMYTVPLMSQQGAPDYSAMRDQIAQTMASRGGEAFDGYNSYADLAATGRNKTPRPSTPMAATGTISRRRARPAAASPTSAG